MAKQEKSSRPGFVIKLSNETAQKIAEEDQQAKSTAETAASLEENTLQSPKNEPKQDDTKIKSDVQNLSVDVAKTDCEDISQSQSPQSPKEPEQNKQDAAEQLQKSTDKNSEAMNPTWGEYAPYITYDSGEAVYTDPTTKQRYTWSQPSNTWIASADKPDRVYSYEDDTHIYTEADGSKFFWDDIKKAWIPKIDDDFLAVYQMSYGFIDNTKPEKEEAKETPKKPDNPSGVKRKNDPQWFDASDDKNTKVYVSNLPLDLSEEEFVDFMQKCGLVERDPSSQKMKVKLYMDKEQNCFKGDALCTYIKIESVELALKLLDGYDLKGNKVKVERAHFQLKGEYNPALKPKKKKKKELEKIKKMQQKLFDWRPEKFIGERSKHERVVIIKNLFHPTDFDKEVQLILDYQQDLREECTKCGEVRKVVIYDGHPEGVAQVTMKEPEQADAVVQLINERWFGKRQITAEIWDGRTKYRIAETDADINKRIDKWGRFLEEKEDTEKGEEKPVTEATKSEDKVKIEQKPEKAD